jgi:hypothetical protein
MLGSKDTEEAFQLALRGLLKDIFNLQVRRGKAENLYSIFCWVIGSARRTKLHR